MRNSSKIQAFRVPRAVVGFASAAMFFTSLTLGMGLTLGVAGTTSEASAQEIQLTGPLAGAPACRHCRIYRSGRFQLQPFVAATLQDEFRRTIPLGLQLQFHVTDWLGIGVVGAWGGLGLDTGLTDEVARLGQTTDRNQLSLPSAQGFPDQIGQLDWFAALQLAFIPLRGKLALFQQLFIDADFYIFGGLALIGIQERADVNPEGEPTRCSAFPVDQDCLNSQFERQNRIAFAPTFGVGLMLYATDFFGISFEWRAMPFAWNTSGTDEATDDSLAANSADVGAFPDNRINSADQVFHFNHMAMIGFAFYLPTAVEITE